MLYGSAVTALILLGSLGESYPTSPDHALPPGAHPPPWPAYLLVVAAGVVLVWRHRWQVEVLAATVVLVSAYSMLGYVYGAALIAPAIALYTTVSYGGVRRALLLGAVSIVLLMVAGGPLGPWHTIGGPATVVPFEMAAAVCLGLAVSSRRAYIAAIQDRAERAERTREEEARRRVDVERLRIARELHDVVAHTMATINVQAAAAAHLLVDPPPQAAEAIAAIRSASKEGLRELRTILNVLRQADEVTGTQPTPGLTHLDALIASSRRAGLPTTVHTAGTLPALPAAVDLAAYRIIQESLTNTLRHAGPATATVELAARDGRLCIHVGDTGAGTGATVAVASTGTGTGTGATPAVAGTGDGHGLIGMRERAASVGGVLVAGPAPEPGGGFHVRAELPFDTVSAVYD
ncbi:two-component sensor histidine kinase [Rugosimonospora africana]|uniref:histidine kinase n=1 Tax=Rugosimonospora africana TaxID=556532 RepID=A0A8J3VUJ2_9ACTN|nr:two-component sensor histidine kinase [Rugosimonospora africana]